MLKAIASALKVEVTTLGIFLELHAIGHTTDISFLDNIPSVEKINVPCLDAKLVAEEKEASEKAQKVTSET